MGALRVEAMLSSAFGRIHSGGIVERVVGPVHERVLAKHGGHDFSPVESSSSLILSLKMCPVVEDDAILGSR